MDFGKLEIVTVSNSYAKHLHFYIFLRTKDTVLLNYLDLEANSILCYTDARHNASFKASELAIVNFNYSLHLFTEANKNRFLIC